MPARRLAFACATMVRSAQLALSMPMRLGWRTSTSEFVLIAWFATITAGSIVRPVIAGLQAPLGMDAVIYAHAARALLEGGDPWRVTVFGLTFAAPPPSLLPYLPVARLQDTVVAAGGVVVAAVSAWYAIRRLALPAWWMLFPPVALGIAAGSSVLPMMALLVRGVGAQSARGSVVADALASVMRVQAALPLAVTERWRSLLLATAMLVATAPFLAWPTYLGELEHVRTVLDTQSGGGLSSAAIPWLVPIAVLALVALGRRRAAWLLIPAMWPDAQLHYSAIALPVLADAPLVALCLAYPFAPGLVAIGLAAEVGWSRLTRWTSSRLAVRPVDDRPAKAPRQREGRGLPASASLD